MNGDVLHHLSLFSGYEGFGLGLRLACLPVRTVGYVEIDDYCQRILQARMRDGLLDWAPIVRDIRCADFRPMAGLVDIITAGFPCQPHSVAGLRAGAEDERNLWPDTLRTIGQVGPRFAMLENVPGITSNGYAGTVVGQLSEIGYDCRWGIVSAAEVGAPHRRARWWCLAHRARVCPHADGEQPTHPGECQTSQESGGFSAGWGADVADAGSPRCQGCRHGTVPMGSPHAGPVYSGTAAMADTNCPRRGERPNDHDRGNETRQSAPVGSGSERSGEELADAAEQGSSQRGGCPYRPPTEKLERCGCELAHTHSPRCERRCADGIRPAQPEPGGTGELADAASLSDWWGGQPRTDAGGVSWWAAEPTLGRVVDGHPHRVDQVRTLGNGIVPAVVARFLREVLT